MEKFFNQLSDLTTSFIGSWYFIGIFFALFFGWIILQHFWTVDPYPYILLNLVLSTLAAIQGSVILMSQSRQELLDRKRDMEIYKMVKKCKQYVEEISAVHHTEKVNEKE